MLYLSIALGLGEKKSSINRRSYMMVIMHADLIFEELAHQSKCRIERSMKLHGELMNENCLTEERKKKLIQTDKSVEKLMLTIGTVKVLRYTQKNEVEGGDLLNETVSCLDLF